jgi:hypothetical protein
MKRAEEKKKSLQIKEILEEGQKRLKTLYYVKSENDM